jgi:Glycosyltransferase family 92
VALQAANTKGLTAIRQTGSRVNLCCMDALPAWLRAGARTVRDRYRRLGYLRARWHRPLGTRPPINLAICAILRDEARYLAEWVCFHRIQGVEQFYLYDNRSTDDWRSVLEPEITAGTVDVRHWPFMPGQAAAYEDCLRRHRNDSRWIAFIDVDEFLFSPTGRPLPDILRGFDMHPGVVVNWRIYGTNGWEQSPPGLVTENYLWRGSDDHPGNRLAKSIVYPRSALGVVSSHYFRLRGTPVGEDRRPRGSPIRESTVELLRINHYYAKSDEDAKRKAARPDADTGTIVAKGFSPPPDAVRDETILQFGPQLKAMLSSRASQPTSTGVHPESLTPK